MILAAQTCQEFLEWELTRRTRANAQYSLRAFAQHLGMSPGELSEILRGKRRLSLKAAMKVATRLGLNADEMNHLIHLAADDKLRTDGHTLVRKQSVTEATPLTADLFSLVSAWYCLAILELQSTQGFKWDAKWIAKRLGINEVEVRVALDRLVRVGMLERDRKGYSKAPDFQIDPRGIPSEAVREFHRQMLDKASQALELQAQSEREIAGLTVAVDKAALPAMKKEISQFLKSFNEKFGKTKKRNAVYQMEMALFQLTQEEKQ